MRRVLMDTSAIYAFVVRTDAHHREALAFTRAVLEAGGAFLLADLVFAETMTLLKVRLGSSIAVRVGRELRHNPVYQWIPIGPADEQETWNVFQQYEDKLWSYTDCALFVLARQLHIGQVFTFDAHFDQMPGLSRVP